MKEPKGVDLGSHYKDVMLGNNKEDFSIASDKETEDELESEEEGSEIRIEERNVGQYACSAFFLSEREKARLNRPWKNVVIAKLLGRKIGYKV